MDVNPSCRLMTRHHQETITASFRRHPRHFHGYVRRANRVGNISGLLGPRSEMDAITDFVQDAFFHMRKPSERGGSNYCLKGGTVLRRLCLYAISSVKALVRAEKGLVWIRTGTHASLRYKEHFSIILLSHQCTVGLFMWLSWFK